MRRSSGDASAALLEGICDYQLGEDTAAQPLLLHAESRPEHRDLARFYLGLIALRAGEARRASVLFEQASANSDPRCAGRPTSPGWPARTPGWC